MHTYIFCYRIADVRFRDHLLNIYRTERQTNEGISMSHNTTLNNKPTLDIKVVRKSDSLKGNSRKTFS